MFNILKHIFINHANYLGIHILQYLSSEIEALGFVYERPMLVNDIVDEI